MHFINKLIKKGTFSLIFVFLFFVFFGASKASAADCTIKLNDNNEYLVLNTRAAWSDSGVSASCDGVADRNVVVQINSSTTIESSASGANAINQYITSAGFYRVKYYLKKEPTVMVERKIRVLPTDLNGSINTWAENSSGLNTAEDDTFNKIIGVSNNGYIAIGNFGNKAYIAKYNLIGKLIWSFECLSEDWFVNGVATSASEVNSLTLTDIFKVQNISEDTDFYLSGYYTKDGVVKAFVRRIQLSLGQTGGLVNSGKFVSFDEMSYVNKIMVSGNYLLAAGYKNNSNTTTSGKIARATINGVDLIGIKYYENTLDSKYNSLVIANDENVAKVIAVGNSAVENQNGAVGGYITTCNIETFGEENSCTSENPYFYLTYNMATVKQTYFNDIVSRENGFLIVGRSNVDRVRGQNDSYNTTNTENVFFVSLNNNLGIIDVQIKDNNSNDNLEAIRKIDDTKFMAVGKKANTGYYATIELNENGSMSIVERVISGTNYIHDMFAYSNEYGEINYAFVGDLSSLKINDVEVENKGNKDAFITIIDITSFDNFDNISILQNQDVCDSGASSDSQECAGNLVLDTFKLVHGTKKIGYPDSAIISSKTIGDIATYHEFSSFNGLVEFIIGRTIVVIANSLPDDVTIDELGIDKWYLYNRIETNVLRDDTWEEFYYPVENNIEKISGVKYYLFKYNTSTGKGEFIEDTSGTQYTNANYMKFENETHNTKAAFQGEIKAKEYALLQEYSRIKLVNKEYNYSEGINDLGDSALLTFQKYYFVYYIDLELEHEEGESCNIDFNGRIRGLCTNEKGYAFANLKSIQRVLNQIVEQYDYFVSEQNVRYTSDLASKPTTDYYNEETSTIMYAKEMSFGLKDNAYLVVEFYETLSDDEGYYFSDSSVISSINGKTTVVFGNGTNADYKKEGKYIVKYCYNYGKSNEVCGNSAAFVIDRTVPTIGYKVAGGGETTIIKYNEISLGKNENTPALITKDINISNIFDIDPYAFTLVDGNKYYLRCNANINDQKCINNLAEYVKIAYGYDKNDPDKVYSITASDRAGNEMTFYFKIGTQMMELTIEESENDKENSFNLIIDIYERNDFKSLAIQYVKSENCEVGFCTSVDEYGLADFGTALSNYIKAIIYLNKLELNKVKEDPEYVIDETRIIKSISLPVSLSTTLENKIVGGISIPKINYNNETKEYEILDDKTTFAISKGLYNFVLLDSFFNKSKAVGGVGIKRAELDVYINSNEDDSYLDDLTRFENGTSKLPSNNEDELVSTSVYFKAIVPNTYSYQDLIPTTLYNDFNKNMLFTNQFVYVKFKINNFGILKISVANNLNTMNNYITDSTSDDKYQNLTCLFTFYGEEVAGITLDCENKYKFSEFSNAVNELKSKGIYFIGTTNDYYYLAFTENNTYHINSELYTDITGVSGAAENMITLPIDYSFVIDNKKPNIGSQMICDATDCKGEKNNFNTSDFIYRENDDSYKIINIGNYSVLLNLDTETLKEGIINRLLVMTFDKETYYNPYTCSLGKCDESINSINVEFDTDGNYIKFSKSGTYVVTFVDAGGNEITYAFVIDKDAPSIDEIVDVNNKNLSEYQQYVDVKITVSENSFLESKTGENILVMKYWVTRDSATTEENAQAEANAVSLAVVNNGGNCEIGTGSGSVTSSECDVLGTTSKSLRFSFVIAINKEERKSDTNTLKIIATDYFNNSYSKNQSFIFDNKAPYIYYDDSYTPTTKFGQDNFDDNKDLMLSMSANASLDDFACEGETVVAETGKILCKDLPTQDNISNNVTVNAYEAYRVTYNNYAKDISGSYVLRENGVYADANVTLYKKIHARYMNSTKFAEDLEGNANIYVRGAYINVTLGEQIDPNETYYYGSNKTQVNLQNMLNKTYDDVCLENDIECELYHMYNQTGKFTNTNYYTKDKDGFTLVENKTGIQASSYASYYSETATYIEDSGKYLKSATLPNSCVQINDGNCNSVKDGRIKLIANNVKYYNLVDEKYYSTGNTQVVRVDGKYAILDTREWQIAISDNQEVKFGFGLVSRFGRPIIFRAKDGAGNYSANYLETVIIIEDRVAPSVIDIATLEYMLDNSETTTTYNNYIKVENYYKVNNDLRNTCVEDRYYRLNEGNYVLVNCGEINNTTQYYVKVEEYQKVENGITKLVGTNYYVRYSNSLKADDGKYNLTDKNLIVTFSEPIYKLKCTYYSSVDGEEKDCSFNATEFDYRENKISFELTYEEEGNYFVNYTLTVYDFFDNQTVVNYLFIDRQKPTVGFYDNILDEDRIEANYDSEVSADSKYNKDYLNNGYGMEIKSSDAITSRINSQGADNFIRNGLTYNVAYYKYNYNLTYKNYIKNLDGTFSGVADGLTKEENKKYYTLMKKISDYVFRGDYSCSNDNDYCYVEDYYNYYPSLLTNSSYWTKLVEDEYGNIAIKNNSVGVYKIEYIVTDLAGNISDTLIKTVYVVDTKTPEFNINGETITSLSGYYNKVQILFSNEEEGIYQVYYCTDTPEHCVLPSNIFSPAGGNLKTETKYISDIAGEYNYTSNAEGIYKFFVYDKGNYNENRACLGTDDCEKVMYLKYNYASHQFIIDTTKPILKIDAEVDEETDKLYYMASLSEDAKLYCEKGELRGDVSFGNRYIECEDVLNGSYKKEAISTGYNYIKTNNDGEIVYRIVYTKLSPTADKYFYITYYYENSEGGFSEYPMGYNFTSEDANNVYRVSSIVAYLREDGGYVLLSEDKATNKTGRFINGAYEEYSRIDIDNTAPSYNKNQNLPTGASYWYSVPTQVINSSNERVVSSVLSVLENYGTSININSLSDLNSEMFYAFATKKEASDYLYSIYVKHVEDNIYTCNTNKYCYSYYDINLKTFINNRVFDTKAQAITEAIKYISRLVIPTYGGDKLFDDPSIKQLACDSSNNSNCNETNMYKYVYLKKNASDNSMTIEETCSSTDNCIKVKVKIVNYASNLQFNLEINEINTLDTQSIKYYYKSMSNIDSTHTTTKNESFSLVVSGNTYYIFEEIDKSISYINSSDNSVVSHNNKTYYAIFVDDNSYLETKARIEKDDDITEENISINDMGVSNTIKTNANKFYLIIRNNGANRFAQKYEIYEHIYSQNEVVYREYYSYLRLARTISTEYNTSEKIYENINDYLKYDESSNEYYFEIPVGIADDDNMIVTIELMDRAGNVTRVIVSKSKRAPNIQLVYQGEGRNQYAQINILDTWNTKTISNNLDVKWSSNGNSYETNEDILRSLTCSPGTTGLVYGCENIGAINGKNSYIVKITNTNYTYGFFEVYLEDDHGNTNTIKFIYNPLDFSISYSTDETSSIKYIDNNTFLDEEQRMISKGNLVLEWNDIVNYINLYKISSNNTWELVCTSKDMIASHAGDCGSVNQNNRIEAIFNGGTYESSKLTYADEGIYKAELVNRQSILINSKCVSDDGTINCKDIYTDVSNIMSWETNEAECLEALQVKREETSNYNTGRRYSLFEIDKTSPKTEGIKITVNKPSGNVVFNSIEEFIADSRRYINSEVKIEWNEKLVILNWSCNYNITYTIVDENGDVFVKWSDNGSTSSVAINGGSFTIGQTYYTITRNNANQDIISWNENGVPKSAPITRNEKGYQTFNLLNPCTGGKTLFNSESIKTFGINSKNDIIYSFFFEDFAGNITENSEYTFTINIKLPEMEIYEVDANGNKLVDENDNPLLIKNGEKVRNNVKLFCYEDGILVDDCMDLYVVDLQLLTANGYVKREPSVLVKETYGHMASYKYTIYVKKDTNGNYYPSLYTEIEFTIDKQPPKIIINGTRVGSFDYFKGEVTISLDDSVNGTGIIYDSCVSDGNDSYICNENPLDTFNGVNYVLSKTGTYKIIAKDEIGNVTLDSDIEYITIDNDSPDINVVANTTYVNYELAENSYTNANTVVVTSVDNNPGSYLRYRINEGEWITVEDTTIQFTEEGIYEIKAYDSVGNESIERHFIIYRQTPKYQLFVNDSETTAGDAIKGNAYLTWKEPTSKAEAPIVKVIMNGNAYTKKQKIEDTGEYVFVITDLAGNTATYKISINNNDNICLNNVPLKPHKQYLLKVANSSVTISGNSEYSFKKNDTLIFAVPTSQYKGNQSCGAGMLGYRSLDENAYLVLSETDAQYINEHTEAGINISSSYQSIIDNLDGYVYVFVVDRNVAKKDLGMNIGENFFNKDPLGWSLLFIAGLTIVYGLAKVLIFRKKVKVL